MKKEDVIKYIETAGDKDFVIRTADEEATYLANHAKKIEEEVIPSKIADIHNRYDDDVLSVTGLKKNADEKTYAFVKRVLSSLKTDAEKAKALEVETAKLKEQIASGSTDKALQAELASVQNAYQTLKDEKDKEINTLKTSHETYKAKSEIMSALPGIQIKKDLPEDARETFINSVIDKLVASSQWQEGQLVFMENGVVKRNPHNALKPYTPAEMLNEMLKSIKDTSRKPDGKGPGLEDYTIEKDKDGKIKVALMLPTDVKTKEDLSKYLVSIGLLRGTKEYIAAYAEYSPNLPMR